MRVLGVDPGSRATGWALVTFAPAPALEAAGVLRPPTGGFGMRLLFLRDGLAAVIREWRPDAASVERVFAGVNPKSLIALGEARGVLLVALAEAGVPVTEVTPAEVKRSVTGTGAAGKEQVRRMVTALLGRRLPLDASDAAAAALAHGFVAAPRAVSRLVTRPLSAPAGDWRRKPSG